MTLYKHTLSEKKNQSQHKAQGVLTLENNIIVMAISSSIRLFYQHHQLVSTSDSIMNISKRNP
jgi:hypothetical protein